MQTDLFNSKASHQDVSCELAKQIPGLDLYFNFITREEEAMLIEIIDKQDWLPDLSRRVQHYGYKYDYRAQKIDPSFHLGDLPPWLLEMAQKLIQEKYIDFLPDQAIINEYLPGQGIAPHIDCQPCFGSTILSISLGSSTMMRFKENKPDGNSRDILLLPRCLLLMKDESRFNWTHGISGRKSDVFNGEKLPRSRRISITFRKVVMQ